MRSPFQSAVAPHLAVVLALAVILGACGDPEPGPADMASGSTPDLAGGPRPDMMEPKGPETVALLTDTQYYASSWPELFTAQTEWIVRERAARNIVLVLHQGDVVDTANQAQWTNADRSMRVLDGVLPYILVPGNHDYLVMGRATNMNDWFPLSRVGRWPSFGGVFEDNRVENTYHLVDIAGQRWLVLALEYGPRDRVLEWASLALTLHPDLPAIVMTHAYLYYDSTRYDHVRRPEQHWNPHASTWLGTERGNINDGEEMWTKLVEPHPNVKLVLSGHVLDTGLGRLTNRRKDGSVVHQVLFNAQVLPRGGDGFLRLMEFSRGRPELKVTTYSPVLNQYKRDAANEFTLVW